MDVETQEWIRWGLGIVLLGYVRYTHMQIKEERDTRNMQMHDLGERLNYTETQVAIAAQNASLLTDLRKEVNTLSKVVYLIAGKLGIKTGD